MNAPKLRSALVLVAPALVLWAHEPPHGAGGAGAPGAQEPPATEERAAAQEEAMQVQYLEIVTPDVDATCSALERLHGVEAAVKAAAAAGGEVAMTATEIPGHGRFAIYFLGGIQYGLWEL